MDFIPKKQAFSARINALALGTGERAFVIGGENVLPFYTFDAPVENRPRVAVEISDRGLDGISSPGMLAFYAGCEGVVDMARRAETMEGASAVCLNLESADPNAGDAPIGDCVALVRAVSDAISVPLLVMGSKNVDKDAELFRDIAEALRGRNALLLSAREENYRAVGETARTEGGPRLAAESSVDINLAKQLNVLLSQTGVTLDDVCMNAGSAAAGYGFEYLVSTLDRIRFAALAQNDAQLQTPVVTPVSTETWSLKETMTTEKETPEWGSQDERIVEMEVCTAAACLVSGSGLVVLKHPAAVAAVSRFIDSLM